MDWEQVIDAELSECEKRFVSGDFIALMQAFRWATMNGRALPDWMVGEVFNALTFTFEKGGAPGRGKTGGYKARRARDAGHKERHRIAARELHKRKLKLGGAKKREEAFDAAQKILAGTPAQGSIEQIERSYNRIERQYRPASKTASP